MYAEFASVYDRLMDDFQYPEWARYYLALIQKMGAEVKTACDCGCGTGSMTLEFARAGLKMTGADLSEEMLRVAAEKARGQGVTLPLIRQDMRRLSLHRPVDAVFACCDAVNYLQTAEDVRLFFQAARAALKADGVLAFDISSRYKLETEMGNAFFGEERDDVTYLWQNTLEKEMHRVHMDITFFVRRSDGLYEKFVETHVQRAHDADEIRTLLASCGFQDICVFGDRTFVPPAPDERRIHFIARNGSRI